MRAERAACQFRPGSCAVMKFGSKVNFSSKTCSINRSCSLANLQAPAGKQELHEMTINQYI
ncbi:MAG: hypothetical protein ACLR6J_18610 [Parabacteroides merdae]